MAAVLTMVGARRVYVCQSLMVEDVCVLMAGNWTQMTPPVLMVRELYSVVDKNVAVLKSSEITSQ